YLRGPAGRPGEDDGGQEDGPRAHPGEPRGRSPRRPRAGLDGPAGLAVLPDDGPPAGRQAEALRAVVADGHPRPRAGDARGPGADPVEPTHGPARGGPRRDGREAELVRPALEVGDLSQGPEVGLPGRAGPAADGRAA